MPLSRTEILFRDVIHQTEAAIAWSHKRAAWPHGKMKIVPSDVEPVLSAQRCTCIEPDVRVPSHKGLLGRRGMSRRLVLREMEGRRTHAFFANRQSS
jgi:hypothetical protein